MEKENVVVWLPGSIVYRVSGGGGGRVMEEVV